MNFPAGKSRGILRTGNRAIAGMVGGIEEKLPGNFHDLRVNKLVQGWTSELRRP